MHKLPSLFNKELVCVCVCVCVRACRRRGGLEEERAERQRWNEREQKRIMDSVQGEGSKNS